MQFSNNIMIDTNTNNNASFLSKVSDYLIDNYSENLSELCIVFPNRRAGLFLKNLLADKLRKTFWSPKVFSIEDFMCEIANKKITENIRLLIELYAVHKNIEKENAKSFDEFIRWGQMLLNDFNEVDLYLVNANDLFGYLSESKAISLWNTDEKPLTAYQIKYLHLYKSLASYYKEFTNQLASKNIAYQGMVYRFVAENIENIDLTKKWHKIIFVGFNALTTSEEKIIKKLIQLEKAEILWDADKYYAENNMQEAGTLIRKNIKSIGTKDFNWLSDDFKNSIKEINIIGAVNGISQAKVAGNIIKEKFSTLVSDAKLSLKTALVLVDENLLLPVLYSLPPEVVQLNITMGFPLKNAPVYTFFDNIFAMHENAKRFNKPEFSDKQSFYFKDLIKLFAHPNILSLFNANEEHIVETIIARNKVFWQQEEILALIPENKSDIKENFKKLLSNWNVQPNISFECMANFIAMLQKSIISEKKQVETEEIDFKVDIELSYLFAFSKLINNLQCSLSSIADVVELKTLHSLFSQTVSLTKLPFYGEPLKGLQLMGLLETRTLDFDNLIILSVNEGLLPSGKTSNSLIPVDIKRQFNLATYNDHDSIYAYHFYRLLQRAKNVYLLYNTETDDFGKGERSRFINQIIDELPKYNSNIKISESIVSSLPEKQLIDYTISIKKNEFVYNMLKKMANNGMSPSAINAYRNCKLKFYFLYLLKLKETESVQEKIDAITLGNIIHEALHVLYKPYINRIIEKAHLEVMLKEAESIIKQAFLNAKFSIDEINFGKNHLIFKVAIKLISNFIHQEIKYIDDLKKDNNILTLMVLEKDMYKQINILVNKEENIIIKLKGKADRIDSIANTLRIIDYKTGYFDKKEVLIKDWEDLINKPFMDKSFQLLFYAYLAKDDYNNSIQSGIISFRNIKEGFHYLITPENTKNINNIDFNYFENVLQQILTEMFDKNIPFNPTEEIERCTYCPFAMICNRA